MNFNKVRSALHEIHRMFLQWAINEEDDEYAITMNRMFALVDRLEKMYNGDD